MPSIFFYSLFYILMAGCFVYPPTEFVSAGLTITDLFAHLLDSEEEFFIQYHIQRNIITNFVLSMVPLGYGLGLMLLGHVNFTQMFLSNDELVVCTLTIIAIIIPMFHWQSMGKVLGWLVEDWSTHYIAQNLAAYCNNNSTWDTVADDINTEYRRLASRLVIHTNSVTKIIVTDNWIMKVTPFLLHVAHQSDTALVLNRSDTHSMSPSTRGEVQYVNIEVKPMRPGTVNFNIRLNALDFKDFQDRIARPITVLPNVTFHKTLLDRFIDTFKEQVAENPRYHTDQELEQCVGCMQATANVKLTKNCEDVTPAAGSNACIMCYCRPMWCIECMAKWFASRQDDTPPETWLSSKCMCPVCRAKFCILDVSHVETTNH